MIKGQLNIFDLDEKEDVIEKDFTKEQQDMIDKLKKKDWLEYSLYESGMLIFIVKEQVDIKVIPQEHLNKQYSIKDDYKSYFIKENGEIYCCGLGITRWDNPLKTIK